MYITIIRNRLSNVYQTPPTRFLMFKSSIMMSNMSHYGEIPAKHHQLAYISFQSSNTYMQKNNCQRGVITMKVFQYFKKQSPAHFQQEAICCDNDEPLFKLEVPLTMGACTYFIFSYPTPADITNLHTSLQIKAIFKYLI